MNQWCFDVPFCPTCHERECFGTHLEQTDDDVVVVYLCKNCGWTGTKLEKEKP